MPGFCFEPSLAFLKIQYFPVSEFILKIILVNLVIYKFNLKCNLSSRQKHDVTRIPPLSKYCGLSDKY